jgi:hypothetical protein
MAISLSGGKKRTIEEVEEEREQVAQVMRNVKKPRLDSAEGSLGEFENPESWTPDEVTKLQQVLIADIKPEEGMQLNDEDQQHFERSLQQLSEGAVAKFTTQQGSTVVEHSIFETPDCTALEKPAENNGLNKGQPPQPSEQAQATRKHPLLSAKRPIQPASFGRKNASGPVFPSSDMPLKEGVSLENICRFWPNHLHGSCLRRFIQDGWKAGRIFVSIQAEARAALEKAASLTGKKGWEIIQQRLDDEANKMAEEEKLARIDQQKRLSAPARTKVPKAQMSGRTGYVKPNIPEREHVSAVPRQAPGHGIDGVQSHANINKRGQAKYASNVQQDHTKLHCLPKAASGTLSQQNQPSTEPFPVPALIQPTGYSRTRETQRVTESSDARPIVRKAEIADFIVERQGAVSSFHSQEHKDQCRRELEKQYQALTILFSSPTLDRKSHTREQQLVKEEWIAKARQFERDLVSTTGINVSGIHFESNVEDKILVRQGELFKRDFFRTQPLSCKATSVEVKEYWTRMVATTASRQLSTLRLWSAQREKAASDRQRINSCGSILSDPDFQRRGLKSGKPSENTSRNSSAVLLRGGQNPHGSVQEDERVPQQGYSMRGEEIRGIDQQQRRQNLINVVNFLSVDHDYDRANTDMGHQNMFSNLMLPQQTMEQPEVQQSRNFAQNRTNTPSSSGYLTQDTSHFPNIQSLYPVPTAGIFQPQPPNTSKPTKGLGYTNAAANPPNKKRGAPRTVMFPFAPSSDTPLPRLAQTDDKEVLRSFPEHLSLPDVMRRFVCPNGSRSGAWSTSAIIKGLWNHWNERDYPGMPEEERHANLSRWIVKERDACNNKIRKDMGAPKGARKTPATSVQHNPSPFAATASSQSAFPTPSYIQNAYSTTSYVQNARPAVFSPPGTERRHLGATVDQALTHSYPQAHQGVVTSTAGERSMHLREMDRISNSRPWPLRTPAPTGVHYASEDAEGDVDDEW